MDSQTDRDTETAVTTIHFASYTTHAKCSETFNVTVTQTNKDFLNLMDYVVLTAPLLGDNLSSVV